MKKLLISAAIAAAAALPVMSQAATTFSFDPDGAGAGAPLTNLVSFDQAVGNALSINGANVAAGGVSQLLYQANLATLNGSSGPVYLNGTGGNFFTFVAGFSENIASLVTDTTNHTQTATFTLNTSQPTFFYMYATSAAGNNLTGTGFAAGKLILSGTINPTGFTSSFVETLTAANTRSATQAFDQTAPNNDYPGVTTVTGSGATSLNANITFYDPAYFPTFSATTLTMSFFNTTQKVPFQEVDPSARFNSNGTIANDANTLAAIGAQNGISGPNFQFQADANSSFATTAIPEPASIALVGLALAGVGFAGRRRNRK